MNKRLVVAIILAVLVFLISAGLFVYALTAHADDDLQTVEIEDTETQTEQTEETAGTAELAEPAELTLKDQIVAFIKEKILPYAISIVLSVGTLYVYLRPILLVIKDNVRGSKTIQADFVKYKEEADKERAELAEKLQRAEERLDKAVDVLSKYEGILTNISLSDDDIKKMLAIAFGNSAELVRKGAARAICKIAEKGNE